MPLLPVRVDRAGAGADGAAEVNDMARLSETPMPTDLHDRTGERCVACRNGVYGQLIVRERKAFCGLAAAGRERKAKDPAAWVHPKRVRCAACGATADRWREG